MTQAVVNIPGRALIWLIASFGVLILPQLARLPIWLIAACIVLAGWRWLAQTGRVRLPGRILRTMVMLAVVAVYVATVKGNFSVDTAASFFVLAVGLKWLETRASRDFYVLFFILIYLAAVNFLFEQGIVWTLLNLLGVVCLLVGLQVLNAPGLSGAIMAGWKRLAVMLLKTLPVVVVLFLFFPRMAPLWSVPLVSDRGVTGISDTMTPGSISNLAQSSKRAFRVTFGGQVPAQRDRYWRGLVLDQFDGETWAQQTVPGYQRPGRIALDGGIGDLAANEYDVLLDASNQRWAFALDNSEAVSNNVFATPENLFVFQRPADTTVRYRLAKVPERRDSVPVPLSAEQRRQYLQLPADGNPRARALAGQLAKNSASAREFLVAVLYRFRKDEYFYTLKPPQMPENGIDSLLFDIKRGFCAHYAGATTFLLRAAGIPARVVVGYQGGENGVGGEYLIVRQYDAHAWVEAWLPELGWVRVDPTAAISPARIESGLREAMADEGSFLENDWISPQRYGDVALVQWASLQMDRINYNWQRWVVGYQGQSQMDLMSRLPGGLGMRELGYLSAGLVGFALLVAGLITVWRQHTGGSGDPRLRLVYRWHRLLEYSGMVVQPGETPDQLAHRAGQQYPEARKPLEAFARAVNNHYYGDTGSARRVPSHDIARMKRLLSLLRKHLRRSGGRQSQKR
ncbi:transglutaminase TgpA family protein [Marinobacter caseinilyticus]|uniref:transglutaminase TgpA family protein n=1 Tax=Marinobacter caseinilyticus TaxID=2692195 RepID=UPI00140A8B57|nr:DUF3488 and DUF4129 domain-containing transglutaminase family protein [Marinobacter caseinilyticus]